LRESTARLPKTFGTKKFKVKRGKSKRVKVKLTKAARKRLRKKHRLKAYAVISMKAASGKTLRSAKRITLKLPR
jgi:hypothetical protein